MDFRKKIPYFCTFQNGNDEKEKPTQNAAAQGILPRRQI